MSKIFDPQVVNPIITKSINDLITAKGGLVPTKDLEIATQPIEEYEGRMRVNATEIFDVPVYIANTNFYLNKGDMQGHRARGAMVVYVDMEVADKVFKAAGLQVPYDEDDGSMEDLCGQLCQIFTQSIKDGLEAAGFISLEASTPFTFKNTISEGVEFSKDQQEKQRLSCYYLKHKALVVDWTLAPIPRK